MKEKLIKKIKNKTAKIGVIGLGYVGLPNFLFNLEKGYKVTGYDIDEKKVLSISKCNSYIDDISSESLKRVEGSFEVTSSFKNLYKEDIIFIDVPTPILDDKTPDLSFIASACSTIINAARNGQLIVLESTVSPGTTHKYLVEQLKNKNFKVGQDIFVGYSPERIDPGNKNISFRKLTRIISGYGDASLELMELLFEGNGYPVSSLETAEFTKLYENTFRFINIALVNEMYALSKKIGISFDEVNEAASSKGFGFMKFHPSFGVGGHCIPVDPYYLLDYAYRKDIQLSLLETSSVINENMIYKLIIDIEEELRFLGKDSYKLALIGASYKPNIKDTRMSLVHKLGFQLLKMKIDFSIFDNIDKTILINKNKFKIEKIDYEKINTYDLAIILQEHDYLDLEKISIKKFFATRF